ncbi:hypothetical protein [Nocardia sp. alder85J]|uniref:hypothetical protein n=1 Tax=Nocardia sp. alder85J TaxID=2862949 RepID=UPI001CD5F913|nr:hypothetical protein [Nocardia sp. alder85J]MCX4093973.1 hypothetical protein [Nocardia sp. alder85J]
MSKVTLSTTLPISAATARALAATPALFAYVVHPILTTPGLTLPDLVEPGVEGSARLWWFGVVPSWHHHLRLVRLTPTEIYTNEWGGPVRIWNHRLTFEPLTATSCRYTDEIETDDGVLGLGARLFVHVMFRWRHRRWHELARVLADGALEVRPAA